LLNKNQNTIKSKKIVFKIPEFPHVSETFIVAQIVTAIQLGYDVQLLIRKLADTNISFCSSLIVQYSLLDKIIIEDYKIPLNKFDRVLKWVLLLIINFKDVYYIIKYYREHPKFSLTWLYQWVFYKQFNNVSIIHVQYGTHKYPIELLKKTGFLRPAIVVTFHGHDAFFPLYGYIENNGYYENLFNNDISISANTIYLADKIKELGCPNDKISIIPVGVDTSFFYPNKNLKRHKESIKLITVGRLDKVKGHKYCIEVIKRLLEKGINATLTIVGEGEERSDLEALIKKYKIEDSVFLIGSKGSSEIRTELWNHDVYLLLAAPVEYNRRETQGLATLEAQACGLPVIVFDSGGVKYTVKNDLSGFVCKEFDVEEVVRKVEVLSCNEEILAKMGKNAVKFVNMEYSQKIIDEKWKCFYKKIIENE
jgi:colanic acid/amylovoran biosynthesis glycosyltransferase